MFELHTCLVTRGTLSQKIPLAEDYPLLGMTWEGKFYFDKCMPMSCAGSCRTFECFSTALEWVAQNKLGIKYILHILDDSLVIAHTGSLYEAQLTLFLHFCKDLGVPMAPKKLLAQTQFCLLLELSLTHESLRHAYPKIKYRSAWVCSTHFLRVKKVCLKDLQSLTGLLNFTCSVVIPGRAFLKHLYDLAIGVSKPRHLIRLTKEMKADLRIWQEFLLKFNGRSFFLEDWWLCSQHLRLFTEASGSLGFGAIFGDKWCYGEWPSNWKGKTIAILAFYPIVLSLISGVIL